MHRPYCDEHPQVPAVARCVGCGKYLCRDCVVEMAARAYCPPCLEEERRRLEATRKDALETPAAGVSPQAPSPAGMPPGPVARPAEEDGGGTRAATSCLYHPGIRAVARCSRCGAFICSGCQRAVGSERLCEVCHQLSFARVQRVPPGTVGITVSRGGPSLATAPWRLWPGLAFLPLPFMLSGLMTYMMRQGQEVSVGAAQLLLSLILYSTMLFFAFIVVSRYGPALREMGLHAGNLPSSVGLGFLGGVVAFWLAVACAALSQGFFSRLDWIERWLQGFSDVNVKSVTGIDLLIAGIIIVIAAPVCEEIFFRGYLYPAMRNRLGIWAAVILNSLLFSAVHFSIFGLIGRTLAGIIFCLLYEYHDNLWSPITAHAFNNFVAFFLPLVYITTR